jgi:ubiquinol-cytochrome c reductase cytochrome c subunit
VAGLLVVLLGLLLTGGLYAAFSPASARENNAATQVKDGHQLFLVGCSFCHGTNGEGVKTLDGNQLGPSLVGVGAAAVDFQVGTGRMPATQPGPQIPQKEKVSYTPDEIAELAAYVASLGPGPAIPNPSDYNLDGVNGEKLQEMITRGGEIFLTNCTACHNFEGSGGAMPRGGAAPSLRGVEPKYIFEAMLTGPQAMDNFSNGNLSVEEKRDIIAYLQSLEANPGYGGFGMGGIGPVSEGMFAWVVGMGSLVGIAIWIAAHTARSSKDKAES